VSKYSPWVCHPGPAVKIVVSLPPHIDIARRHRGGRSYLPELSAVAIILERERRRKQMWGEARPRLPVHKSECDIMVCCTVHWKRWLHAAWWLEMLLGTPSEELLAFVMPPTHQPLISQRSFHPTPLFAAASGCYTTHTRGCMRNRHHTELSNVKEGRKTATMRIEMAHCLRRALHSTDSTDHQCMLQDNAYDCQELHVILHATLNLSPGYKRHAMLSVHSDARNDGIRRALSVIPPHFCCPWTDRQPLGLQHLFVSVDIPPSALL
jgi:hypothetical protein